MFFVRFILFYTKRCPQTLPPCLCRVTELPVHHIYARTHSWRSSSTTCHFVNIYIPTVHRLCDQHLNKPLSLVYVYMCSQVTDATIALAKKEKQIKILFLRLTDRGILGGIAPGGGGGYFRNLWVGVCRWDPGTLNLYQS